MCQRTEANPRDLFFVEQRLAEDAGSAGKITATRFRESSSKNKRRRRSSRAEASGFHSYGIRYASQKGSGPSQRQIGEILPSAGINL